LNNNAAFWIDKSEIGNLNWFSNRHFNRDSVPFDIDRGGFGVSRWDTNDFSIAKGSLRYKGIALNPIEEKIAREIFELDFLVDKYE
jgi:hypothetical protein